MTAAAPVGSPWRGPSPSRNPTTARQRTATSRRATPRWRRSQKVAAGVVQTEVKATSILPSLNVKTARSRRGILPSMRAQLEEEQVAGRQAVASMLTRLEGEQEAGRKAASRGGSHELCSGCYRA